MIGLGLGFASLVSWGVRLRDEIGRMVETRVTNQEDGSPHLQGPDRVTMEHRGCSRIRVSCLS